MFDSKLKGTMPWKGLSCALLSPGFPDLDFHGRFHVPGVQYIAFTFDSMGVGVGVGGVGCGEALQAHASRGPLAASSLQDCRPERYWSSSSRAHQVGSFHGVSDAHPEPASSDLPLSRWESRFPAYSASWISTADK